MKKKSMEEQVFEWLLDEAREYGLIEWWIPQPKKFVLTEKKIIDLQYLECIAGSTKPRDYVLLRKWTYTPDQFITLSKESIFTRYFGLHSDNWSDLCCYTDTKGTNESNDQAAIFRLKQLMMWHVHGIYVNKIRTKYFCEQTWTPQKYLELDKQTQNKMWIKKASRRSIEDFIRNNTYYAKSNGTT
jgi:hypothetical protein